MPSATVEVARTHDPTGAEAPSIETIELESEKVGQTMPDVVEKWIRPYHPTRTGQNCVYRFDSPEHGTGTITVTMWGASYRERMDEKVQLLEIERAIGQRQPCQVPDTMRAMEGIQLQVKNPYLLLALGGGLTYACVLSFYTLWDPHELLLSIGSRLLSIVGVAVSIWFALYPAFKRRKWWHRARAEVKRRGEKMPLDLSLL